MLQCNTLYTHCKKKQAFAKLTAGVSKQPGFGEGVGFGLLEVGGEAVYLYGPAGGDEGLLQHLLLVPVLAEPVLTLPPLQDDVDVAGD